MMRATAARLDPNPPAEQIAAVRSHFESSGDPDAVFGRFLLGSSRDDEIETMGREPLTRVRTAYYRGIKALADGADMEAAEWLLLGLELPRVPSADKAALRQEGVARQRANNYLDRWMRDGKPRASTLEPPAARERVKRP